MAKENTGLRRQGQHLANRLVQHTGIATRKITPRGAIIRHEQGVSHKGRVTNHVSQAGGSMARRVHYTALKPANRKGVTVPEKAIKLTAIAGKFCTRIKGLAENFLHIPYVGANAGFSAEFLVKI